MHAGFLTAVVIALRPGSASREMTAPKTSCKPGALRMSTAGVVQRRLRISISRLPKLPVRRSCLVTSRRRPEQSHLIVRLGPEGRR